MAQETIRVIGVLPSQQTVKVIILTVSGVACEDTEECERELSPVFSYYTGIYFNKLHKTPVPVAERSKA